MKRPSHVKPPKHLTPSTPVPVPEAVEAAPIEAGGPAGEEGRLDPTRYGDWEKEGKAIDF